MPRVKLVDPSCAKKALVNHSGDTISKLSELFFFTLFLTALSFEKSLRNDKKFLHQPHQQVFQAWVLPQKSSLEVFFIKCSYNSTRTNHEPIDIWVHLLHCFCEINLILKNNITPSNTEAVQLLPAYMVHNVHQELSSHLPLKK